MKALVGSSAPAAIFKKFASSHDKVANGLIFTNLITLRNNYVLVLTSSWINDSEIILIPYLNESLQQLRYGY